MPPVFNFHLPFHQHSVPACSVTLWPSYRIQRPLTVVSRGQNDQIMADAFLPQFKHNHYFESHFKRCSTYRAVNTRPSRCTVLEHVWNVMAHAQKPDFVFRRNGRVHLNRRGASVQSTTVSRGVRISGSNAGYTMFWGRVQDYWLPAPLACFPFTSPTVCHCVPSGFNWALSCLLPLIKLQWLVSYVITWQNKWLLHRIRILQIFIEITQSKYFPDKWPTSGRGFHVYFSRNSEKKMFWSVLCNSHLQTVLHKVSQMHGIILWVILYTKYYVNTCSIIDCYFNSEHLIVRTVADHF